MLSFKSYKKLVIALSLIWLLSTPKLFAAETQSENLKLAQGDYKRVSPLDISTKPDIIQDREAREQREEAGKKLQKASESTEKEITPTKKEPPVLVGNKPSQIYYRVSVNDKLFISVWRVPDLSLEFIVGPDGKISFPLIGDIEAAGRTLAEIDAEITGKLKEYVNDPQVSVMVREFAGDRLTVMGEVRTPGIYKFVGRTNIISVIALAGGFTDRAKSASIVIVREPENPGDDDKFIVVDMKSILKGDLSKNIEVRPNDIIYVSRTFVSNLKEFYDNWITPPLRTAIDYETWKTLRRTRLKK